MARKKDSQVWAESGLPSLGYLVRGISDAIKANFFNAHANSYLGSSIVVIGNEVYITAPKYNMLEVARFRSESGGDVLSSGMLQFYDNASYANELDSEGSKIAVWNGRKAVEVRIGNWQNFAQEGIVEAVKRWAAGSGLRIEDISV